MWTSSRKNRNTAENGIYNIIHKTLIRDDFFIYKGLLFFCLRTFVLLWDGEDYGTMWESSRTKIKIQNVKK